MSSETTSTATQYRLQEWAAQIRECQNRLADMSVVGWCTCHGITKANYYYRLRRVRETCLANLPRENPAQQIVPVNPRLLQQEEQSGADAQWTDWRRSLKRRPGTGHIFQIRFIFSAGDGRTASKESCGKGTAGSCYTRGCQKVGSNGRAVPKRCSL